MTYVGLDCGVCWKGRFDGVGAVRLPNFQGRLEFKCE
jgi:hypothetical protein